MLWGEKGGLCAYYSHSLGGGLLYDHGTDDHDHDEKMMMMIKAMIKNSFSKYMGVRGEYEDYGDVYIMI